MPINLDNVIEQVSGDTEVFGSAIQPLEKLTPKVFDKMLTGSGKGATGFLNTASSPFDTIFNIPSALKTHVLNNTHTQVGKGDMMAYPSRLHQNGHIAMRNHLSSKSETGLTNTHESAFYAASLYTSEVDRFLINNQIFISKLKHDASFNGIHRLIRHIEDVATIQQLKDDIDALEAQPVKDREAIRDAKADLKLMQRDKQNDWRLVAQTQNQINFDMYMRDEVVYMSRQTLPGTPTSKDPNPKSKVDMVFAPMTTLTLYPKTPKTNEIDGYVIHINSFVSQSPQFMAKLTSVIAELASNSAFIAIRMPSKSFDDNTKNARYRKNIISNLQQLFHNVSNQMPQGNMNITSMINDVGTAFSKGSLYASLQSQADILRENTLKQMTDFLAFIDENITNENNSRATAKTLLINRDEVLEAIEEALAIFSRFETMNEEWVTTNDYNRLFNELEIFATKNGYTPMELNRLASTQLRLLMAQNLHALSDANDNGQLHKFIPKDPKIEAALKQDPNYSMQQRKVVTTTSPLVTVSAGAGSGKSYTLVGRLDYLNKQGEDLSKVMVLSFTNVAAENITSRYPNIKSLTLGNLFNQIYTQTFPQQVLSQPRTFMNALTLVKTQNNAFAAYDRDKLEETRRTLISLMNDLSNTGFKRVDIPEVTARIATFMSTNFEYAIILMNAIGQTTLDLQPIIIHNLMVNKPGSLNIPKEYDNINYIITDESQDISTFEYILLLTLTLDHKANLMIIGDGSQTLYEFRNSNPRFLNAIEASGVFDSYRLTTNYRSKQAILSYANQFLRVIDANKHAKIQLQASTFEEVDVTNFNDSVKIKSNILTSTSTSAYVDSIKEMMTRSTSIRNWFEKRITSGEQIALMSFTHDELDAATEAVEEILRGMRRTDLKVERITPTRTKPKCDVSNVIGESANELRQVPITARHAFEYKELFKSLVLARFKNQAKAFIPNYVLKNLDKVLSSSQYQLTLDEVIKGNARREMLDGYIIQTLLDEEIQLNAVMNYLNKETNAQRDISTLPIVATTIHSAKGLEFDHVFVMYNQTRRGAVAQENLRLFGVALTRAKKTELVLNTMSENQRKKVVTDSLAGMYQTPMETAKMRCLKDAQVVTDKLAGVVNANQKPAFGTVIINPDDEDQTEERNTTPMFQRPIDSFKEDTAPVVAVNSDDEPEGEHI